jgi:hypothetical protein
MNILGELAALGQPAFFDGQRLAAVDLQGVEEVNRKMRWLHNQSLHQPGIGNGYAVTGLKGDRDVNIGPGYAIDADGREIIATNSVALAIPPVAGEDDGTPSTYDLTVSYACPPSVVEKRALDCGVDRGTIRYRDDPIFCWVHLKKNTDGNFVVDGETLKARVDGGQMIVLARVEVLNCKLNKDVSTAHRRSARPPVQPYIACGRVVNPNWQPGTKLTTPLPAEEVFSGATAVGLAASPLASIPEAILATEAATASSSASQPTTTSLGPLMSSLVLPAYLVAEIPTGTDFQTTPAYTARILYPKGTRAVIIPGVTNVSIYFEGLVTIRDSSPSKFTAEISLVAVPLQFEPLTDLRAVAASPSDAFLSLFADWGIEWMGVEG